MRVNSRDDALGFDTDTLQIIEYDGDSLEGNTLRAVRHIRNGVTHDYPDINMSTVRVLKDVLPMTFLVWPPMGPYYNLLSSDGAHQLLLWVNYSW